MSTLKLKGSTSGYVELTAPATAGNNTITLPTTAGTVAVKDASNNTEVGTGVTIGSPSSNTFTVSTNGSERIRVDSSGRFGVGTVSPQTPLSVRTVSSIPTYGNVSANFSDNTTGTLYISHSSGVQGLISDGTLAFGSGASGTERARIDSSGRLLVGTSSAPTTGSLQYSKLLLAGNTVNNGGSQIALTRGQAFNGLASGQDLGYVYFGTFDGGNYGVISCFSDGASTSTSTPGRLTFSTTADGSSSPTERMRIGNDGYLQAFSSTNGQVTKVTAAAGTSTFIHAGNRSATDNSSGGGTTVYYVWSNGNVQNTNGSFTAISDAKLKENIADANSQWNDLKAIQIRNWNFKSETGYEAHRQIGPIAQELEEVCPGLVFETPDRDADGNATGEVTKGVNQSVLYMKAVKALQEAQERIETLEAENATLKSDFTALAARVAALESA